jgi:hypothetical protein
MLPLTLTNIEIEFSDFKEKIGYSRKLTLAEHLLSLACYFEALKWKNYK